MAERLTVGRLTTRSWALSKDGLITRLGRGAGSALFDRLDDAYRRGEQVVVMGVEEARSSFDGLGSGRARIVRMQEQASERATPVAKTEAETMVLVSLSDLEAVVRASSGAFSWAKAFAPRPDLPEARSNLTLKLGAQGGNLKL